MNEEQKKKLYNEYRHDIFHCGISWDYGWEEVEGKCPECGRPIGGDGECVYGCRYSPVECKCCGARPCDGSC